jgi:cytochrome P450
MALMGPELACRLGPMPGRSISGRSAPDGSPLGAAVTLLELEADPHPVLARLRVREPVSWLPVLDGWLVTRRDLAIQVMRDPVAYTVDDPRFSTARVVGPSMLSLDGTEHDRHRVPFDPPFRLAAARSRFTAFIEAETGRLIAAIEPAGAGELRRQVAGPLAVAVVAEALGLADAAATTVLRWYDAIVGSVSAVTAGRGVSAAGTEAFGELSASVRATIAREHPATRSLLREVALGPDEVVSNAAVLMFGGIETTEGMITNAVWHLLTNPDQLARVRAEPALLPNAIEESLRLEPAAATVDRYATRDLHLGGSRIRQGDLVSVSIAGANRDPAAFPQPDDFDVRRENTRQHVAFAHGPHVCLGMHLARIEAQIAVRRLLDRLPDLQLDPDRPSAPRGLVFRKPPTLHVRWAPR